MEKMSWYDLKKRNFRKESIFLRTNNICESFLRTLNKQVSHYHPKISYLADKLKIFVCEAFKKYNSVMIGNNLDYNGKSNTANDIIHFIHNFHSKYNIQLM